MRSAVSEFSTSVIWGAYSSKTKTRTRLLLAVSISSNQYLVTLKLHSLDGLVQERRENPQVWTKHCNCSPCATHWHPGYDELCQRMTCFLFWHMCDLTSTICFNVNKLLHKHRCYDHFSIFVDLRGQMDSAVICEVISWFPIEKMWYLVHHPERWSFSEFQNGEHQQTPECCQDLCAFFCRIRVGTKSGPNALLSSWLVTNYLSPQQLESRI